MAYITYTYVPFTASTLIKSAEANDSFTKVAAQVNGNIETVNLKDASVTGAKLAAGVVNAGKMATLPHVRVKKGSNQSIAHNVLTVVSWDTEDFDSDTIHDTATNNDRLTCKTAGLYVVTLVLDWDTSTGANSSRQAYVRRRNSGGTDLGIVTGNAMALDTAGNDGLVPAVGLIRLAVNDYLQAEAYHFEGDSTAKNVKAGDSHFAMAWISP